MEDKDTDVLSTQTKITEKDAKSGAAKLEESSVAVSGTMAPRRSGGEECSAASSYNHTTHAATGASGTPDITPNTRARHRDDQSTDSTFSQETSSGNSSELRPINRESDVLNVDMHVEPPWSDPFDYMVGSEDRSLDPKHASCEEVKMDDVCFTVRIPFESENCNGDVAEALSAEAHQGETLDALLACAAEEARRCGNPLRRLRSVLSRGAPPPSEDVRPLRLDEAGGDRYELFWSNLGLLRRYQDPLRRALSCHSVSSDDPSQDVSSTDPKAPTEWDLTDEDLRDFLTWQDPAAAAAAGAEGKAEVEETSAPNRPVSTEEQHDDDVSSGSSRFSLGLLTESKGSVPVEFHGNSVSNIWHVERDTRLEIDSGLKNMKKRVHFFLKSLFRVNKRFKKLE